MTFLLESSFCTEHTLVPFDIFHKKGLALKRTMQRLTYKRPILGNTSVILFRLRTFGVGKTLYFSPNFTILLFDGLLWNVQSGAYG